MISLLKSALRNKIFWYLASRYGTFAIQFLTSIWLAVKLGPYYFGLWSFILLLVNVGSQCNRGIANAVNILLVQHKEDRSRCAAYEFNSLVMTGAICIIPFLVALYDTFWPIPLFAKYQLGRLSYAVAFIVAARPILKGEIFTEDNLTVKRPGTGISPMRWDEFVGKAALRDYKEGDQV